MLPAAVPRTAPACLCAACLAAAAAAAAAAVTCCVPAACVLLRRACHPAGGPQALPLDSWAQAVLPPGRLVLLGGMTAVLLPLALLPALPLQHLMLQSRPQHLSPWHPLPLLVVAATVWQAAAPLQAHLLPPCCPQALRPLRPLAHPDHLLVLLPASTPQDS